MGIASSRGGGYDERKGQVYIYWHCLLVFLLRLEGSVVLNKQGETVQHHGQLKAQERLKLAHKDESASKKLKQKLFKS